MNDYDYEGTLRRARLALANSNPGWDEHKHPRRADGKFGSGGGNSRADYQRKRREESKAIWKRELNLSVGRWAPRIEQKYAEAKNDDESSEAYEKSAQVFLNYADGALKNYPVPKAKGAERDKALAERKGLIQKFASLVGIQVGKAQGGLDIPKRIAKQLDWDVSDWEDDDPEDYADRIRYASRVALTF